MATMIIENLKKGIIINFCYFYGIKVLKQFHRNFLSDPRSYVLYQNIPNCFNA